MNAIPFDLDSATRDALGFDALLEMVARRARSEIGAERVLALDPLTDRGQLLELFRLIEELRARFESGGAPVSRGLPDPRPALRHLRQIAQFGPAEYAEVNFIPFAASASMCGVS